jgi:ATP-binding cassette subfamily B multidrug efflux pump
MSDSLHEARRRRDEAEEKEALTNQGDAKHLLRLIQYLAPMKWSVILAISVSIFTALLMLAPMVIIQYAIDEHIAHGNMRGVWYMAAALLAAQIALFALDGWNNYYISVIGNKAMAALRMDVFAHLQQQPISFFNRNPVGRLITRVTGDVNTLYELFAQGIIGIFQQVFFLLAVVGLLFWTNWKLTLWVMLIMPAVILLSRNFGRKVRETYRLIRVRLARLNSFLQENLTGMKTVQAFTREDIQYDRLHELNGSHRDAHIATVFQYSIYYPLVELLCAVGFAIVVYKGGLERLDANASTAVGAMIGVVSVGQLALFVQSLERFFMPIRDLSEKYNLVLSAIAASDRLFKLLDRKAEIADLTTPAQVGPLAKGISFENTWFAYNDEEWVLRDVSFNVGKGQTIAVVGPTGAGKSTLMSLLCRFHDVQKGAIKVDGVDVREMRQHDLRAKIAIVLQDVFLFYGSVASNIRLGETAISDERLRDVARAVHADEFIMKLPKGYDNGVKERGATLSTGQKQLLSFARALAFNPEILILDEATSNIDTETELLIQDALKTLLAGRTALVIAHRLSTIQRADKILVMHHGKIAEAGTHDELLARDGLYRKLYELQFKDQPVSNVAS